MHSSAVPARIIAWQAVIGCVGAVLWLLHSVPASVAALAGGFGSALLSLQFALRVFSRDGSTQPRLVVAAFYRAQVFKLITAAAMFGVVAKFFTAYFVPFVSVFIATLTVYMVALRWPVDQARTQD
ncbi:MAG: ATP synthase subunit I [Pseudomonadota bacterium]